MKTIEAPEDIGKALDALRRFGALFKEIEDDGTSRPILVKALLVVASMYVGAAGGDEDNWIDFAAEAWLIAERSEQIRQQLGEEPPS